MLIGIGMSLMAGLKSSASPAALFASGEVGVWYDPSDIRTVIYSRAGVTASGYPASAGFDVLLVAGLQVSMILDKSKGLALTGAEKVTNGDFTTDLTGWTLANIGTGTSTVVDGRLVMSINTSANRGRITQQVSVTPNTVYEISYTVISGRADIQVGTTASSSNMLTLSSGIGPWQVYATTTDTQFWITTSVSSNSTADAIVDNITMREILGNHAIQPVLSQRPLYSIQPSVGVRNLINRSEVFNNNTSWVKAQATASANTAIAPDGSPTADSILDTAVSNIHYCAQDITTLTPAGKTYTFSIYAKANTLNYMTLGISDVSSGSLYAVAVFNIAAGTVSTSGAAGTGYSVVSSSVSAAGDGWYRCVVTVVAGTSVSFLRAVVAPNKTGVITPAAGGYESYLGNGSGFYAWGAQLELGSSVTAYQLTVLSPNAVTEAGVESRYSLFFDGVDDGMVTNTITPNIDKVQVFSGLRKLSDAATGMVAELSATIISNAGSFYLLAPASGTTAMFRTRGSIPTSGAGNLADIGASPVTRVLTTIGDIAGDTSIFRMNGAQLASSSTDQGTGDYLAYPLYIGRRGGASFPFNGRLYSMIVRFGSNLTDGQITATETWVNGETGAY